MSAFRNSLGVALSALTVACLTACGHGVPMRPMVAAATSVPLHRLAAKDAADNWWDPVVLEDFEGGTTGRRWDDIGDTNPFFNVPLATRVFANGGHALEMLAPANESRMRRGYHVTADIQNGTTYDDTHKFAPHIMVSFDWANNSTDLPGHVTYLAAVFVFSYWKPNDNTDYEAAIGYTWTNDAQVPGTWQRTTLNYSPPIPLALMALQHGPGGVGSDPQPQPCGVSALNGMVLKTVTRQFEKDVAQAYPDAVPQMEAMAAMDAGAAPGGVDGRYVNNAITSIFGVGGGMDLPQGVCSQAVLDNFRMKRVDIGS